ncbi:hypothetical protein TGRUB_223045 [Toxoplasma gondii RUB]|uniref:Uncharacterized protein n=4 Tax=Toxoplasma gondii TaxID=5811 RepID=S7UK56_TOXGG|nr:hypothetical protein TGGT1_223045 [Toxoplasma gondii GT1]KFG47962.1 hypothetical protein TGFOU_223045 [Toxoplasma gondii FOU]KFG61225.1 hypothetical protein TGRUB_223045 [Toxoplasma gondii RUB]RQX67490.1 hypothetical protein TGCAST_223045 [Toxoplasma gondii CAST]
MSTKLQQYQSRQWMFYPENFVDSATRHHTWNAKRAHRMHPTTFFNREGSRRTWRGVGGDGTKPLCEEGSSATLPIPIRSREPDP